MKPVEIIHGNSPIILGQPHSGTFVPEDIWANLNELGRELRDTDWHIPKLYDGLIEDATIVRATFSRYVIDANRDPEGKSLYPGQNTTNLVPLETFDGVGIWQKNPTFADISSRTENFHRPYHAALAAEISRLKHIHGYVILYDCHSIRSELPFLFQGQLPDINIGDNGGETCASYITKAAEKTCVGTPRFTHVLNGRFRGGWTTRHYGKPKEGVHAIQMELAQRNYLLTEQAPFEYDIEKSAALRQVLSDILHEILNAIQTQKK